MIKNYFKTALRNITRHKGYAALNISGLAIGIAACLLLFLVVRYELSYDTHQPNYKNLYHIVTEDKYSGVTNYTSGIPAPALAALRLQMPNLQFTAIQGFGGQVTLMDKSGNITDQKFIENGIGYFCEPAFFTLFHADFLSGDPSALAVPNTVLLSRKIAEKYFGTWQAALNQTIKIDNLILLKVAGILDNPPSNTDFPVNIAVSFTTLKNNGDNYSYDDQNWGSTSSNFQVFALAPPSVKKAEIDQQLLAFGKANYRQRNSGSQKINMAQPFSEVHFDNRFEIFGDHVTKMATLWTLVLIGVFIIIMACINFINLSTAQAVGRSKEIGIRKVMGGSRGQLFSQVMGETGIIVMAASVLAVLIAWLCLPFIKHIASIEEQLSLLNTPTMLFLLAVVVLVTLFAGTYPAFILSGYKPVLALKNKMTSARVGGISLRRGLVVLQFVISQVLIIGTIVAISQMNFVQQADLGFKKESILLIDGTSDSSVVAAQPAFKEKLLQIPGIESVSFNTDAPSSENTWSTNFAFDHKDDEPDQITLKFADEDYLKTFGLKMAAGTFFGKSDTIKDVVINETAVQKLGLKDPAQAVGKDIRLGNGAWKKITGVVKDFKTNSLRESIKPLLMAQNRERYGRVAIKMRSTDLAGTQATVQKAWNSFYPEYAYTSTYMQDDINDFYKQENQLSLLYKIFAGLAILISSLGLFGLVSFMAVQKTKEVGIRKVLGASEKSIVYLFSKEFTLLIFIAFIIAAPLAWMMMNSWLQNFVYRIPLGAGVFAIAIVISLLIAWLTVGYKAVKAAVANPVKSLRSE
jgi:putative ABC transport system permease protein